MYKTYGVAIILQNQKGEFLLHLRDGKTEKIPHQWSLIGGGVDEGESPEDAVVREVKEETELDVFGVSFYKKAAVHKDEELFVYHGYVDPEKQSMTLHEGEKLQFFTEMKFKELLKALTYTNPFLEFVSEFIKTKKAIPQ